MGWPTKGTGNNYNSHTGFGSFLGAYTHKVMMSKIFCRRCRFCELAKSKNRPVKEHICVQNYPSNESSKGMEAAAILHMTINSVPDRNFVIGSIVSDDDSVMRSHLRYPNPTKKKDKGKLPTWILEPEFLADPTHRIKVVATHFYELAKALVSESRVSKPMAKRLKKNWGYMLRQNRDKTIEEFVEKANAPLEHIFGNHHHCDKEWCNALKAQEEGVAYNHPEGFYDRTTDRGKNYLP